MPKPSLWLHLPLSVACDDLKALPELSRQTFTSTPSNANSDCNMNVRKLIESIPQRQRDAEGESDSECKIRARRRHCDRAVMVFKRVGAGRKKRPCGMPNCPTCGIFWRMYIEDLERHVPSLVPDQDQPFVSSAREAMCASSAASTTDSTNSTLTEFTEMSEISRELLGRTSESGLLTPASTCSSVTLNKSSAARLTPAKSPKIEHKSYGVPSPASSGMSTDFNKDSACLMDDDAPDSSSMSTLTDLTEHNHGSSACIRSASSVAASSSTMSTLTDFSELQSSSSLSAPPSSLSSIPPTLSTITTITTPNSPHKRIKVRKHRSMIEMSDGSNWLPPTLERVQAYISSQGERRLARSTRAVVASHAECGSRVALRYENAILKVDLKVGKKFETSEELLDLEDEDMGDGEG